MAITGTTMTIRLVLREPPALPGEEGALQDAPPGTLTLLVIDPDGGEKEYKQAECAHDSTGKYHKDVLSDVDGLWHYRWLVNGEAADEGSWTSESEFSVEFTESEEPDLTDLRVLVPRARRKIEGPFGFAGKRVLTNTEIYAMVADGCAEIVMLSGSLFNHTLEVKKRDPLGGFPTDWKTNTALDEWEAAVICAQVALDYYFHVFNDMKISETIQNEGTQWTWDLSANVIREYLTGLREERDRALLGLRVNNPVLDVFASNIRVRDQATVAVLEWWAGPYDHQVAGGLPGGQEASVVPVFFPPGVPYP